MLLSHRPPVPSHHHCRCRWLSLLLLSLHPALRWQQITFARLIKRRGDGCGTPYLDPLTLAQSLCTPHCLVIALAAGLVTRRQRLTLGENSPSAMDLARQHLPMETLEGLLPVALANNEVIPQTTFVS